MKQKLLRIALFAALFVMMFSVTSYAESFTDIEDSSYKDAIITLSKLNVINGYEETDGTNTFRPENTITRAEFTKMLVAVMGYEDASYYSETQFTDIDMWAKNYITTAYGLGIVNGMSDTEFAPDELVTYEQAQKMMVCALGYVESAEDKGGWPTGYIQVAGSLELKDSISGVGNSDAAPRGVIAQLMYNSLNVEMREYKNAQWQSTEKTLLNDYLGVIKLKGTLVGAEDYITNECTVKLGNSQMDIMNSKGEEILISFAEYTQNVTDINKYLGNIITVYYREAATDDQKTLIAIDDETTKNTETEIRYDDIVSYNGSYLVYTDSDGKQSRITINMDSASVRYNGKPISDDIVTLGSTNYSIEEAIEQWLTPESDNFIYGEVKLTDSGSDGDINLIQIYDYETIVAYQAPKVSDYRITDKLISGNYLQLDPNASDYTYTIQKNGAQIETTSIAAGDVVLYAESLDGSLYTVYVTSNPVTGSISTVEDDYIYIGNNKYKIGELCEDYINKNQSGSSIKVGVSGTFYLDMYDTIVYGTISTSVENLPYSYISNAIIEESEDAGYLTVYVSGSTEAKTYKMSDKVKLNGSSLNYETIISRLAETAQYSNPDASDDWKSIIYGSDEPTITQYSQVARVKISNNLITNIVTVDTDTVGVQNESTDSIVKYSELEQYTFSSSSSSVTKKGSFKLKSGSSSSTAFSTDDSTTVIYIPKNRKDKTAYASKGFTNNTKYYAEAYDISSSKIAGLVLIYSNEDNTITNVSKTTNFGIVASLPVSSYDEDEEESIQQISVYYGPNNSSQTTVKSWNTLTATEFEDIQVGDVIQFAYDTSNRARDRIDNIRFSDIADVLDGNDMNDGKLYDWNETQEPSEENNYQTYKFDYRFKSYDSSTGGYEDEEYTSGSSTYIYSRACMYNVSQVFEDDSKIYVTKNGFDEDGSLDDSEYEEIEISSSTKILRMETNRKSISKYAQDTTTDMSITDLKSAQYYGSDCSKILVCSSKGSAKLIVVYN